MQNVSYQYTLGKFESEKGKIMIEFICKSENEKYNEGITKGKFYITEKTLPRLQALHQGIFGEPSTKSFSNEDDIIEYFTSLIDRAPYKKMNAGGRIWNNKVLCDLSFSDFMLKEEDDYEEGEFPINGELFQKHITSDIKTIDSTEQQEDMFTDNNDDNPF